MMSGVTGTPADTRRGERGSIMVMTAILMVGLVLAVGLCIDVARIYMLRAELQNAADAAALAGARELNSGITGINDAATRATTIVNTQGFGDAGVTVANVEFSVNLNGAYTSKAAFDAMSFGVKQTYSKDVRFIRVTTQPGSVNMLFAGSVLGAAHSEGRTATAGMSVGINTVCDFYPIAVALQNPNPAPGTNMTLKFAQGNNTSVTLADKNYVMLEVPDINGNGTPETAQLTAGVTSICKSIGNNINITPSSNQNNGPRAITDGTNTRFNVYANGYGNSLRPTTFPPDTNINETISHTQYKSGSPVTTPSNPGAEDRRILVVPVVAPGVLTESNGVIIKFAAFFLRKKLTHQNPCNRNPCAEMEVEYVGDDITLGRGNYDPGGGSSNFTIPVLYK